MENLKEEVILRLSVLEPIALEVHDDSYKHASHGAEGANLKVIISSSLFDGKTYLDKHRLVYKVLQDLMPHRIHSLELKFL
jgi:BolA family transcriptional regulator, general stress-responsive regulator